MKSESDWEIADKKEVLRIKNCYRDSLSLLGRSRESHLYELRNAKVYDGYYKDEARVSAWNRIEALLNLEATLDAIGRKILNYDCLEYGRHYRFWYLGYLNKRTYEKKRKKVLSLVKGVI